jgi:ketopantoate reductase
MCNGYIWPVILDIKDKLGGRPIRVGMTTIGSTIMPSGEIRIFANGTITAWGHWPIPGQSLTPPTSQELRCLESLPNGTWHDDIRPMIRRKWILNVAINSVAAVHRLERNGLLVNHKQEVEDVLVEAYELSEKLWHDLSWDKKDKEKLFEQLWLVVEKTADNQNSMVRDVMMGRRTESDYLAGIARDFTGFNRLKAVHEKITQHA